MSRHISLTDPHVLDVACEVLTSGGIVVAPTDTVYGMLVDARSEVAVRRLIELKARPPGKAISIFVSGWEMMEEYVEVSQRSRQILQTVLPGCYTVVLPSRHRVCPLLESETGTLGIRYIGYTARSSQLPVSLEAGLSPSDFVTMLVAQYGGPVTATSANLSGHSPHSSVDSYVHSLSAKQRAQIDLIIDGGVLPRHDPSTVMDMTVTTPRIIRAREGGQVYETHSPEDTMRLAGEICNSQFAIYSTSPMVMYLHGDPGAGKTHFVKGLASAYGIDRVVSPTYVGVQEYETADVLLYHVDLYNYQSTEDIAALHLDDLLRARESQLRRVIMCIEWSEMATLTYPGRHIYIEYTGQSDRRITIV